MTQEFGKDVESVERTINLHPITAIAPQSVTVKLPLELGPKSVIDFYYVREETNKIVLFVRTKIVP